eukprot:m.75618 g.75618  ORF g.75618 m.75618 type:complete len:387 (-) comp14593_c0_seq1:94-1254(-)
MFIIIITLRSRPPLLVVHLPLVVGDDVLAVVPEEGGVEDGSAAFGLHLVEVGAPEAKGGGGKDVVFAEGHQADGDDGALVDHLKVEPSIRERGHELPRAVDVVGEDDVLDLVLGEDAREDLIVEGHGRKAALLQKGGCGLAAVAESKVKRDGLLLSRDEVGVVLLDVLLQQWMQLEEVQDELPLMMEVLCVEEVAVDLCGKTALVGHGEVLAGVAEAKGVVVDDSVDGGLGHNSHVTERWVDMLQGHAGRGRGMAAPGLEAVADFAVPMLKPSDDAGYVDLLAVDLECGQLKHLVAQAAVEDRRDPDVQAVELLESGDCFGADLGQLAGPRDGGGLSAAGPALSYRQRRAFCRRQTLRDAEHDQQSNRCRRLHGCQRRKKLFRAEL